MVSYSEEGTQIKGIGLEVFTGLTIHVVVFWVTV
jgi:hypothetical protein